MSRARAHNLLLLLGSSLIALVVLEVAVRSFVPRPLPWLYPQVRYQADPELVFRLAPNQKAYSADKPVHINSRGARGPLVSYDKNSDKRRILFLGDSVAFGYGVRYEDAVTTRLEAELQQRGIVAETINLSVPAYNTVQEVALLEQEGVRYSPDVVVLAFYWNDLRPKERVRVSRDGWLLSTGVDEDNLSPLRAFWISPSGHEVRNAVKRLRVAYGAMQGWKTLTSSSEETPQAKMRSDLLLGRPSAALDERWTVVAESIARFKELSTMHSFSPVVVGFPIPMSLGGSYPDNGYIPRLRELCDALKIPLLDLEPAFREAYSGHESLYIAYDGDHPNARGHSEAAREIAEFLVERETVANPLDETAPASDTVRWPAQTRLPKFDGWEFRGDPDPLVHRPRDGARYYIGDFAGAEARDDLKCGSRDAPCATLAFWNRYRRAALRPGDTLRFAPGTYRERGATHHCLLLDEHADGVTFEGRTADDRALDDGESVLIDLSGVSGDENRGVNPCRGVAVTSLRDAGGRARFDDVIIRDLGFSDAPRFGIHLEGRSGDQPSRNLSFERIQVVRAGKGAAIIGRLSNSFAARDTDCADGGRDVRNVRIADSVFAFNRGFPGGINLGCVDGVTITGARIHDVCGLSDCRRCAEDGADDAACNDHDGIVGSGAINVVVRDSEIFHAGEDGIDFGGHPYGKSHHILIENNVVHDNATSNIKVSGARFVMVRNNVTWGRGDGIHTYSCPHNLSIYHNTFLTSERSFMAWEYLNQSLIANNIFYVTSRERAGVSVWLDVASTNDSNYWNHNVIARGHRDGIAMAEYPGSKAIVEGCDRCRNSHLPPPLPCDSSAISPASGYSNARRPNTASGLRAMRAEALAGSWFGRGAADDDRWGIDVRFVDESRPSRDNLRLANGDAAARATGGYFLQAKSAGNGTTVEVVGLMGSDDPRDYFVSPRSFRGARGDSIRIGDANDVTITSMTATTISFSPAVAWDAGAKIHFAWRGRAPDRGVLF